MRNFIFCMCFLFFASSCKQKIYVPEKCIGYKELTQTNTLKINDSLPGFTGYTSKKNRISLIDFKKKNLFVFFKVQKHPLGGVVNEEILYNGLGKLAKEKNTDLIIGLDSKIANIYGIKLFNNKVANSTLLVMDYNKKIKKIYKDVCEDDIINILNKYNNIQLYTVDFEENSNNSTENILALTKRLQPNFVASNFSSLGNEKIFFEEIKSKNFLKILARDFENKDFEQVETINFSVIAPKIRASTDISIQQWNYNSSEIAKNCFESLSKYEEKIILYKRINWIWVYQANKIFLISSNNFVVKSLEMQIIKNELIEILEKEGDYKTIQFYE